MSTKKKSKSSRMDALRLATENYKLWRDDILSKRNPKEMDSMRLRVLQEQVAMAAVEALL